MSTASRTIGVRSRAQSLVRFAEALKRAKAASGVGSLVRAHTPHTPRGRALTRRPGSLVRARSSAQASQRSRTGVVRPCGGNAGAARWANAVAGTRHGGTWAVWRGRAREIAGPDARHGSFPAPFGLLGPREQPRLAIEFVSLVRAPGARCVVGRVGAVDGPRGVPAIGARPPGAMYASDAARAKQCVLMRSAQTACCGGRQHGSLLRADGIRPRGRGRRPRPPASGPCRRRRRS